MGLNHLNLEKAMLFQRWASATITRKGGLVREWTVQSDFYTFGWKDRSQSRWFGFSSSRLSTLGGTWEAVHRQNWASFVPHVHNTRDNMSKWPKCPVTNNPNMDFEIWFLNLELNLMHVTTLKAFYWLQLTRVST